MRTLVAAGWRAWLAGLGLISTLAGFPADAATPDQSFTIATLSTAASRVSGGDVLVRIDVPRTVPLHQVTVRLNGGDVTGAFLPAEGRALVGLVTGLRVGDNTVAVDSSGRGYGRPTARLKDWLLNGSVKGVRQGELYVDADGKYHKQ